MRRMGPIPVGVALLILTVASACQHGGDDDDTDPTTNDDDSTSAPDDDDVTTPDDDDTTGTTDDDDDTCENHLTETACPELINPVGDLSCLGQNPDPEPGEGTVMVSGVVRDFQAEVPVGGALLEVQGTEFTATSAPDGSYELEVPARQRINIRGSAPRYKVTWQYWILTEASDFQADWLLVQQDRYRYSQAFTYYPPWGITPDPATCLLAGSVMDCQDQPLAGYGITIATAACTHPQAAVKWFKGEFPNGTQCPASDDGLWGAININPPEFTVQLLGTEGEVLQETGALPCEPDAFGVLNLRIH